MGEILGRERREGVYGRSGKSGRELGKSELRVKRKG